MALVAEIQNGTVTLPWAENFAGGNQRREIRLGAAGGDDAASLVRHAQEPRKPSQYGAFDLGSTGGLDPDAAKVISPADKKIGNGGIQCRGTWNKSEKARMIKSHGMFRHALA